MTQQKLNFSFEEDERLIEEVAANPAIYDLKHALYKDQRAKEDTWVAIAEEVGRPVADCKKRWKNIKDTYDRKCRETHRAVPKTFPFKKGKKWALQKRLSFLGTLDDEDETFSNIIDDSEAPDNRIGNELQNTPVVQKQPRPAFVMPRPQTIPSVGRKMQRIHSPEKVKRMKMCFEKGDKEKYAMMKELISKKEDEQDDITLFFLSIAKSVKKLPPHLQHRAKLETLQLVSNIEMDVWSSRSGKYARTETNTLVSPSPGASSTYSEMSRSPSTSTQSDLCGELPAQELYALHHVDIKNILSDPIGTNFPK